jgi:hypothetical protein
MDEKTLALMQGIGTQLLLLGISLGALIYLLSYTDKACPQKQ